MSDITADYSFGGWLRRYRIKHDWTLRDAAKVLDMDVGNLSKLERSHLDPPTKARPIKKICTALAFENGETEMLLSLAYQHHLANLKRDFES